MAKKYKCGSCSKTFDEPKVVTDTYTVSERPPSSSGSGAWMPPGEYTNEYDVCPHCGSKYLLEWFEGYRDPSYHW